MSPCSVMPFSAFKKAFLPFYSRATATIPRSPHMNNTNLPCARHGGAKIKQYSAQDHGLYSGYVGLYESVDCSLARALSERKHLSMKTILRPQASALPLPRFH
jgi:hypothetical protein